VAGSKVEQGVLLARKVKELTAANGELAAEIEALRRGLVQSSRELAELRTQIGAVGKPQSVFIDMLGESYREVEQLRGKVAALEELITELTRKRDDSDLNFSARFDLNERPATNPEPFVIARRSE
jgi:chromosome segregation ATPase